MTSANYYFYAVKSHFVELAQIIGFDKNLVLFCWFFGNQATSLEVVVFVFYAAFGWGFSVLLDGFKKGELDLA